jgi:ribose transport system permease protein
MTSTATQRPAARMVVAERIGRYGTIVALAGLVLVFSALRPEAFVQFATFVNILQQSAVLTVVAVGLTVCMVMFEFDLSVGYMASLGGVLATGFMAFAGFPWPVAILLALAVGAIVGLVSGLVVTQLRVDAFIATLAMGTILVGLNFWYNGGGTISTGIPADFIQLGRVTLLGLPLLVWIAAAVCVVVWVLLNQTPVGRNMYAIGGNAEAARLAGIGVTRARVLAFMLSATCAALGGIMLSAQFGLGFPNGGDALLLQAFTANFLGAVTLRDGEFHVLGTVIGVLLLAVIFTGLTILGVPLYVQNWTQGALLIAAVALSGIVRRFLGNAE